MMQKYFHNIQISLFMVIEGVIPEIHLPGSEIEAIEGKD